MFGLKYSFSRNSTRDIVCTITDGTSVTVSFGNKSDELHMMCYTHGLHLAVQDVFYKKNVDDSGSNANADVEGGDDDEVTEDEEVESDSSDVDDSGEEEDDEANGDDEDLDANSLSPELALIVGKVRKVLKSIRKSPLKNNKLQEYIRQEHGKEFAMICDNVMQWNSAVAMVKRFLKVKACSNKVEIDFPKIKTSFDGKEIDVLKEMIESLEPVKLAVEKLSRRSIYLLHEFVFLTCC